MKHSTKIIVKRNQLLDELWEMVALVVESIYAEAESEKGKSYKDRSFSLPIFHQDHPTIKLIIEAGPETEAEHYVFMAKHKDSIQ